MKKKVLYLHGLESKQGGEKVSYLAGKCFVHAPEMDYTRKDIFPMLTFLVEYYKPDLIIGSSMGGYTAYILGALYDMPVIIFNPALHSRSFTPNYPDYVMNLAAQNVKVVLGEDDTVIDPRLTLEYLKEYGGGTSSLLNIEEVKGMGHKIPLDIFISKTIDEL